MFGLKLFGLKNLKLLIGNLNTTIFRTNKMEVGKDDRDIV